MAAQFDNPLSQEHLDQINKSLEQLKEAEHQIALAERAGLNVGAQKQQVSDLTAQLKAIKQVYFPTA